jgi:predicted enzyme related to lactoylglutathione lyase
VAIEPPGGTTLYFQRVPEPKTVKNRAHICLQPEVLRDQEVERIRALGATIVADQRDPDGSGWVVMADPEGNEFCVLRSDAERRTTA